MRDHPVLVPLVTATAVGALLVGTTIGVEADPGNDDNRRRVLVVDPDPIPLPPPPPDGQQGPAPSVVTGTPSERCHEEIRRTESMDATLEMPEPAQLDLLLAVSSQDVGATLVFGDGEVWLACDTTTESVVRTATLLAPHPLEPRPLGADQLAVSISTLTNSQWKPIADYAFGVGRVPAGVTAIEYDFGPTVVPATLIDGFWVLQYLRPVRQDPWRAEVEVSYADGRTEVFPLTAPEHLCAHVNHTC